MRRDSQVSSNTKIMIGEDREGLWVALLFPPFKFLGPDDDIVFETQSFLSVLEQIKSIKYCVGFIFCISVS